MTKHPNPDRCEELGMLFLSIHNYNSKKPEVDMLNGSWDSTDSVCETVACHAGWFAWGTNKIHIFTVYSYKNAADEMSEFLKSRWCKGNLECWAQDNPTIWGNRDGDGMFVEEEAFGVSENLTLEVIGKHWLKVAARIREAI